jgi:nucleotide-binding universal stress UspA family protein
LINISKDGNLKKGYNNAIKRARKMLRRCSIDTEVLLKIGDPVDNILNTAGDDHIIIMGASTQSPLAKFFVGSKPLDVVEKSTCPILIVK